MRRKLPFLLLLLLFAEDARASCAPPNPREQYRFAHAAFDGRFESQRGQDHGPRRLTFRVDRVLKGQLGETVEVYERGMSSVSFSGFAPGERVGLMLIAQQDGSWQSNACLRYDPEELADALEPLRRPPGRGTAAFLAGGNFGDASLAALDRRGRTIAYGFGGGRPAAVCPGGRRFVAIATGAVVLRRTRDLRTIRRVTTPRASSAHCLRGGVYVASGSGIFRGRRRVWRGPATRVVFHGRRAFVLQHRSVLGVDLRSGRARTVASFALGPEYEALHSLAVNPAGTRVAVLLENAPVQPGEPPSRVAVQELRGGPARTADLPGHISGSLVWTGHDRFALLPGPAVRGGNGGLTTYFFDARLRSLGQRAGWTAFSPVALGGAVAGLVGHRLERASAAGSSELGRLPGSDVSGLLRLPGVPVRATRRVPRY